MSVAQVLAELGVHDLRELAPFILGWRALIDAYGDTHEFPGETWADWRCCCGFRATVEHAIPEDMVRRWHDEAVGS